MPNMNISSLLTFLSIFIWSLSLLAQERNELDLFKNMSMRSIGPAVTSGRVTAIDVQLTNPNNIIIGTASGGVWKSENGGINWQPIFDDQPVCGIGAIRIDPSNQDIIWAGTGEGNPRNSQTSGKGIYKSLDGGNNWQLFGLEETKTIHRICVNPQNGTEVFVGALGSAWGPNKDRGIFKTSNGGDTWEKILFVNDTTGCADLVMDPRNPNKLFAAMYHYQRKPWFFKSGGTGSGLHMSINGGKEWKKLTSKDGLPEGELGRIGIAIAPSNSKIVYALIEAEKTGLYKSTDGGYKWQLITGETVDDRPFYYHEIYVDPKNENHLIYLHSVVSESIDGGKTWKTILPYYGVHPDHHAFWWSTDNSDYMIEGNDGGLNISRDGGQNWQFAANLPLGQFYHINYDMEIPYNVYGGMQDNGSWRGPSYVWHQEGIRDADWLEIYFGDGFDVVPNPQNSRYVYAMSQGGNVVESDLETGSERYISPTHPDHVKLRYNWNSGIAQDPFDANGLFYGSQFLHYSNDNGASWKIISPDLTTNDTTKQKGRESGGLTIDATTAENYCSILTIAPSTINRNVIWVGTDDGNIQVTQDGGKTWKNVALTMSGLPKNSWIPQIVASTYDEGEAFVVANNYRQNDWKPYVFHTKNYGKTWTSLVDEKKVSGHCLSIAQDHVESKLLFLGTEHGLYISFDFGQTWSQWKHNYPSVATQDLKIHPRENDLIIGTFGRAAYVLDDIAPLRNYVREKTILTSRKLVALPSPDAYQANLTRPVGQRFPADGIFEGENKPTSALLNYYFNFDIANDKKVTPEKSESKNKTTEKPFEKKEGTLEKSEAKKVSIHILNLGGDTLRTLLHEPDTGLNSVWWGFDTFGENWPSRTEKKLNDPKPGGGIEVEPGKYKVVFMMNELKDSTEINVFFDPRLPFDQKNYNTRKLLLNRHFVSVRRANQAFENIKEANKNIDVVINSLVYAQDSLKKNLLTLTDSIRKELKNLEELFMLPADAKGIRDESDKLQAYLWSPFYYVGTGRLAPSDNSINSVAIAEKQTELVVQKVNDFFALRWLAWQKEVNKIDRPIFKEIKKS